MHNPLFWGIGNIGNNVERRVILDLASSAKMSRIHLVIKNKMKELSSC